MRTEHILNVYIGFGDATPLSPTLTQPFEVKMGAPESDPLIFIPVNPEFRPINIYSRAQ